MSTPIEEPTGVDASAAVPESSAWWSYTPILLAALIGLLVTWMVYARISELEQQRRYGAFSEASRDRLLVVQREIDYALGLVHDIGAFFDASSAVTRRQFREFVAPTLKRTRVIKALQWVPKVGAEERDRFLAHARRDFASFRILASDADAVSEPVGGLSVQYPVLFVQPYRENRTSLGLDLGADPAVRAVLEEAAERGGLLASAPYPSVENTKTSAFAAYLPVFARVDEAEAIALSESEGGEAAGAERGALRGVAVGLFRIADLVDNALSSLGPSGVDIYFFIDGEGDDDRPPFHVHSSRTRGAALDGSRSGLTAAAFTYEGQVQVAGQTWTLICSAVPGFFQFESWSGRLFFVGGIAFTMLTCVYLFALIGRAREVRRLVAQRTLELSRTNAALHTENVERRRAERALQSLNATLEQRVARRTVESERRASDLGQFAYVASHDLKAPLRAISNLADWLRDDLRDKLTPETREQLALLHDRVARMNALIEGLLAYSRIGRTDGSAEAVDSAALVAETIDSIAPPEGFRVEIAAGMPCLFTDRLYLGQVFANLIGNAIHHHDRGRGLVRVSGVDRGERCVFRVEDDGPGIPAEYRDKVFKMFQTLKVKDFGSDTGIGLALVKKLVDEHGGDIRLECGQARGSCFEFTWPTREPETDVNKYNDPIIRVRRDD